MHAHRRSYERQVLGPDQHRAHLLDDLVEHVVVGDQRRRDLQDRVAAVVGARSPAEITEDAGYLTAEMPDELFAELAAEITARMGRDPGEIYHEFTREFGEPAYDRVDAPAWP